MLWISPGQFTMGSPYGEEGRQDDEGPQHRVTITRGFWMADTACTQAMWQTLMGRNPSGFRSPNRPVEQVSWEDVQRFIERLDVPGIGLPSEAQWEYACRAGTNTSRYGELDVVAWYRKNSDETHEVGQKQANAWGLYDMLGNVMEWCADGYRDYGSSIRSGHADPSGPSGLNERIVRGGGWDSVAQATRAAARRWRAQYHRDFTLGFRLIQETK
jgi:formylglycine-generating enzyme required for sulfatase activity